MDGDIVKRKNETQYLLQTHQMMINTTKNIQTACWNAAEMLSEIQNEYSDDRSIGVWNSIKFMPEIDIKIDEW